MDVREIVGYTEYKKGYIRKRRILRMLMLITGLASLMLIVLTYYGHSAGNFVIKISEEANRSIAISTTYQGLQNDPKTRLQTLGVIDASDMTLTQIPVETVFDNPGTYVDPNFNYLAYSFYCMNVGTRAGTLSYSIRIEDNIKDVDLAIRVMTVEEDVRGENRLQTVWRRADPVIDELLMNTPQSVKDNDLWMKWEQNSLEFLSTNIVFNRSIENFTPRQYRRFSIFIWIEGNDPDATEKILGGRIKMSMVLSINPEDIEG